MIRLTRSKASLRFSTADSWRWVLCAAALALASCGGGGGGGADPGAPAQAGPSASATNPLTGTMYYVFAGKLNRFDMASSQNTEIATSADFKRSTFDVSTDGKEMLIFTELPKTTDAWLFNVNYSLVDSNNLKQVNSQFAVLDDSLGGWAKLSIDKSKVAALWENPSPRGDKPIQSIYVRDRTGKLITRYDRDSDGNPITEAAWLPDGNLLLNSKLGILKTTDTTLLRANVLFKPNLPSWGYIAVSPDGKRIALTSGRHIYTVNIDGSNLVQVTNSDKEDSETAPQWSPDGKYIAFRASLFAYTTGGVVQGGGTISQLLVVAADNKTYTLSKEYLESIGSSGILSGSANISGNGIYALQKAANAKVFAEYDVAWR